MASSSKSTAKTTSKEVLYSAENYISYIEDIEGIIAERREASLVNTGIVKDPITNFIDYFPNSAAYLEIYDKTIKVETKTEDGSSRQTDKTIKFKLPTQQQVKDDPQQHLGYFLDWIMKHPRLDAAQKKTIRDEIIVWTQGEKRNLQYRGKVTKATKEFRYQAQGSRTQTI